MPILEQRHAGRPENRAGMTFSFPKCFNRDSYSYNRLLQALQRFQAQGIKLATACQKQYPTLDAFDLNILQRSYQDTLLAYATTSRARPFFERLARSNIPLASTP